MGGGGLLKQPHATRNGAELATVKSPRQFTPLRVANCRPPFPKGGGFTPVINPQCYWVAQGYSFS